MCLIPFKPQGDLCLFFVLSFFQKEFLRKKSYSPCVLQPLAQTLLGVHHGRVTDPLRTSAWKAALSHTHMAYRFSGVRIAFRSRFEVLGYQRL